MATPGFRDYHRRMQLFILLYIEAGSYIQEDDERWEFVVLYVFCALFPSLIIRLRGCGTGMNDDDEKMLMAQLYIISLAILPCIHSGVGQIKSGCD